MNVPLRLRGWVLDILPARDGMEIWFLTTAGDATTLFAQFRPSFVIAGRSVREDSVRAAAGRWGCDVRKCEGVRVLFRQDGPGVDARHPGALPRPGMVLRGNAGPGVSEVTPRKTSAARQIGGKTVQERSSSG